MPLTLTDSSPDARPLHLVTKESLASLELSGSQRAWVAANGFKGQAGRLLVLPGGDGEVAGALFGIPEKREGFAPLATGTLGRQLPEGNWSLASPPADPDLAALGLLLGSYAFTNYRNDEPRLLQVGVPGMSDADAVRRRAEAVFMVRDLINTPASDMGPQALEEAARALAHKHGGTVEVIAGDDLLARNFPMIHAVGRAAAQAPRLIDLTFGAETAPKVTLVGKGVCFDTGGLDIKPASGMLLMKKDMGGAANVLGLAAMILGARLNLRLRVLVPAVENSIAGNAFRPGDILKSRKGPTVEIGNTDAEGRLVLADALALADEEEPELIIDMATLTGAARVALGPDLPPFFTGDEALAAALSVASTEVVDPLWRMPLWAPYVSMLSSRIADINNAGQGGFAGSVTAALFLQRFPRGARAWAQFDIFGWAPEPRPGRSFGGADQAARAVYGVLKQRYG